MMRFGGKENKLSRGFTLLEMVVTATILSVLAMMVLPLAYQQIQRQKERELRRALWEIRDAIDYYKEIADKAGFQIKADSVGYPPDLETLVKGVELSNGVKFKFLRRIPRDPMTNSTEWGLRSNQDDADSGSWGGQAVFDVYTKSEKTALDGTKYRDW
jgi:general secretion pathway protein G